MTYKISDRLKEFSSAAGIAVGVLGAVAPQYVSPETMAMILAPVSALIATALFFWPENPLARELKADLDRLEEALPATHRPAHPPAGVPVALLALSLGALTACSAGDAQRAGAGLVCLADASGGILASATEDQADVVKALHAARALGGTIIRDGACHAALAGAPVPAGAR